MSSSIISSSQTKLSDGTKWFSYSGMLVGDVSVPSTVPLTTILNTGLQDSYVEIRPIYGKAVSTTNGQQLGIIIKINDLEVAKSQPAESTEVERNNVFKYFVPRQSKLEILSINATSNNTQERGVTTLGWYI